MRDEAGGRRSAGSWMAMRSPPRTLGSGNTSSTQGGRSDDSRHADDAAGAAARNVGHHPADCIAAARSNICVAPIAPRDDTEQRFGFLWRVGLAFERSASAAAPQRDVLLAVLALEQRGDFQERAVQHGTIVAGEID
jgi:hypothetical protein